jgi:GMP synthase, PP-ATPase domain/subunit
MAQGLGGLVARTGGSEYGGTSLNVHEHGVLLGGLPGSLNVWMSHGDSVERAPDGFEVLAATTGAPIAAFEDTDRRMAGVQFHPEVVHTAHGQRMLEHFLWQIAGCQPNWTMASIIDEQVERIRDQVGDSRVICGLSGGVDSAVAAALVQRAVGDQLTCIFVDHGLLRAGEAEQVERDFVAATDVRLMVVDARQRFLDALAGVEDPETKRKIIGREFIRVFEDAARQVVAEAGDGRAGNQVGTVEFLVQGTLYPDVVESGGGIGDREYQKPSQRRRFAR